MQCKSHLRQIGLACHQHHEAKGHLPAGAYWYTEENLHYGTGLMRLLPYLEEQAIFDAFDFSQETDFQEFPGGQLITAAIVPVFVCPADDNIGTHDGRASANYSASNGPSGFYPNPDHSCHLLPEWDAHSLAEPWTPTNHRFFAGPFHRNNGVEIRFREITDGLSKTIFFAEVRRECSQHVQAGWAITINGQGLASTLIPINFDSCHDDTADGCRHAYNWTSEFGFKSQHPGGVHVSMGDCAVRFVGNEIDYQLMQYLGAKADGVVVQLP